MNTERSQTGAQHYWQRDWQEPSFEAGTCLAYSEEGGRRRGRQGQVVLTAVGLDKELEFCSKGEGGF